MMENMNSKESMIPEKVFHPGQYRKPHDSQNDAVAVTMEEQKVNEQLNNEVKEAAGNERIDDSPCCLFYTCFACVNGYCTALKDNDFLGRPCPFFKNREQVMKERQVIYERLVLDRREDLIAQYSDVYEALGLKDPPDITSAISDDITAARAMIHEFRQELADGTVSDNDLSEDEYDLEGLMNEEDKENST